MISNVILLDKHSAGQTAGGWIPDTSAPGFHNIDMLVVPVDAAALSVRHIVSSLTVPLQAYNVEKFDINAELSGLNQMYDGQVYIENIGVDQNADRFKYMNRIKYGVAVFGVMAHTIFGIYNAGSASAVVNSVSVSANTIDSEGAGVIVTVSGSGLTGTVAQLFKNTEAVGSKIALTGSGNVQVGVISIPGNATEEAIEYTLKVSTDGGSTWASQTATVTVNS